MFTDGRWLVSFGAVSRVGTKESIQLIPPTETDLVRHDSPTISGSFPSCARRGRARPSVGTKAGVVVFDLAAQAKLVELRRDMYWAGVLAGRAPASSHRTRRNCPVGHPLGEINTALPPRTSDQYDEGHRVHAGLVAD